MSVKKLLWYVITVVVVAGIFLYYMSFRYSNDVLTREHSIYDESYAVVSEGASVSIDISRYILGGSDIENKKKSISLYRVDENKLTNLEIISKINKEYVVITPRDGFVRGEYYEAVIYFKNLSEGNRKEVRVPIYTDKPILKDYVSEYGIRWESTRSNELFRISGFDDSGIRVMGYETKKGLERFGTVVGDTKMEVVSRYGKSMDSITKGSKEFNLLADNEFSMYRIDGYLVTFFYDQTERDTVRSIHWIREDIEKLKVGFYGESSDDLRETFEDLMVDLINDTRRSNGLGDLSYDRGLNSIGRVHSKDMIDNGYFNHVNKKGLNFNNRLENAGYKDRMMMSGENLAYGQMSPVYAHEELMNSVGHRKNILNKAYDHVGVGVDFDNDGVPYWTILFYQAVK